MITEQQRIKILEKLAYYYAEISNKNLIYHDDKFNWEQAIVFYNLELEINKEQGEKYLLSLIGVK